MAMWYSMSREEPERLERLARNVEIIQPPRDYSSLKLHFDKCTMNPKIKII